MSVHSYEASLYDQQARYMGEQAQGFARIGQSAASITETAGKLKAYNDSKDEKNLAILYDNKNAEFLKTLSTMDEDQWDAAIERHKQDQAQSVADSNYSKAVKSWYTNTYAPKTFGAAGDFQKNVDNIRNIVLEGKVQDKFSMQYAAIKNDRSLTWDERQAAVRGLYSDDDYKNLPIEFRGRMMSEEAALRGAAEMQAYHDLQDAYEGGNYDTSVLTDDLVKETAARYGLDAGQTQALTESVGSLVQNLDAEAKRRFQPMVDNLNTQAYQAYLDGREIDIEAYDKQMGGLPVFMQNDNYRDRVQVIGLANDQQEAKLDRMIAENTFASTVDDPVAYIQEHFVGTATQDRIISKVLVQGQVEEEDEASLKVQQHMLEMVMSDKPVSPDEVRQWANDNLIEAKDENGNYLYSEKTRAKLAGSISQMVSYATSRTEQAAADQWAKAGLDIYNGIKNGDIRTWGQAERLIDSLPPDDARRLTLQRGVDAMLQAQGDDDFSSLIYNAMLRAQNGDAMTVEEANAKISSYGPEYDAKKTQYLSFVESERNAQDLRDIADLTTAANEAVRNGRPVTMEQARENVKQFGDRHKAQTDAYLSTVGRLINERGKADDDADILAGRPVSDETINKRFSDETSRQEEKNRLAAANSELLLRRQNSPASAGAEGEAALQADPNAEYDKQLIGAYGEIERHMASGETQEGLWNEDGSLNILEAGWANIDDNIKNNPEWNRLDADEMKYAWASRVYSTTIPSGLSEEERNAWAKEHQQAALYMADHYAKGVRPASLMPVADLVGPDTVTPEAEGYTTTSMTVASGEKKTSDPNTVSRLEDLKADRSVGDAAYYEAVYGARGSLSDKDFDKLSRRYGFRGGLPDSIDDGSNASTYLKYWCLAEDGVFTQDEFSAKVRSEKDLTDNDKAELESHLEYAGQNPVYRALMPLVDDVAVALYPNDQLTAKSFKSDIALMLRQYLNVHPDAKPDALEAQIRALGTDKALSTMASRQQTIQQRFLGYGINWFSASSWTLGDCMNELKSTEGNFFFDPVMADEYIKKGVVSALDPSRNSVDALRKQVALDVSGGFTDNYEKLNDWQKAKVQLMTTWVMGTAAYQKQFKDTFGLDVSGVQRVGTEPVFCLDQKAGVYARMVDYTTPQSTDGMGDWELFVPARNSSGLYDFSRPPKKSYLIGQQMTMTEAHKEAEKLNRKNNEAAMLTTAPGPGFSFYKTQAKRKRNLEDFKTSQNARRTELIKGINALAGFEGIIRYRDNTVWKDRGREVAE